ncbi:NAD(P)/FAD-dependent oxidoreductase [Paeniglutamicibacter kerguelensis]|uniref:3-phenylpropionate/trans-cinnamate dioxygenase ferredoxin reductase subunit n=2 Tax=Paeniglutamicibacter kerguelensis TaxID=254788 RepID=A0ABS4XG93_9MICC|nr:FAD/NAD(P)-binding oxidoreductase [Paeniglutamicibacter kerguelensis]MBP2387487.1 3-phenylpropionate/trans-cinnamate dioxygenase ferredoxin reductase subunit [Paeniglutamicibacter kerguelensis]
MSGVDDGNSPDHNSAGTVVIGGGLAAAHCAHELRKGGYGKPITIIADEDAVPYERPPLSKEFLQGNKTADEFRPFPEEWYAEASVQLRLGLTATAIDTANKVVGLSDSTSIDYENLVIATGCRSRLGGRASNMTGWDLPGVHTLRSLADSQALKEQLVEGRRLVIIGAGWIGMEVAASARAAGVQVTVLTPDEVPLAVAMGTEFGSHVARLHIKNGVHCRFGTMVNGITLDPESGLKVMTSTDAVAADLVLLAIGAVPNNELAAEAGLEIGTGVLVDAQLHSSDPSILAIGDIAEAFNTTLGRSLRVEHWDNAIRQGKLAAATILGREEAYDWLPYFFTDQFDLGMEYVGDRAADDDVVLRGEMDSGEFIIFWLRKGLVTAAMNVNIWDVNDHLRSLVGKSIAAHRLADTSVDLLSL